MKKLAHRQRIVKELRKAGMTPYGFLKLETTLLPDIIHEDEHIFGVAYGRLHGSIDAVMLVATDKRVLYLDCKPFYKNWDEITYEVVAGVRMSIVTPFASVVLHTRVQDYELRYVNRHCATIFTEYIETYIDRVQAEMGLSEALNVPHESHIKPYRSKPQNEPEKQPAASSVVVDTLVLATITPDNTPHTSLVHYLLDEDECYYLLTKEKTTKVRNIEQNPRVNICIHSDDSLKVLYIDGTAQIVRDRAVVAKVFDAIMQIRSYAEGTKLPPLTKVRAGNYCVIKVIPATQTAVDYSSNNW